VTSVWISLPRVNVYASFAFCVPFTVQHIPNITQILAVSAIDTLQKFEVNDLYLKWPNDIVMNNRKLGGILAQSTTGGGVPSGCLAIVAGIGLNINTTADDLQVIQRPIWPATSVYVETGKQLHVAAVRQLLIETFTNNLSLFLQHGYQQFVPRINTLLALRGQQVRMSDGEVEWEGVQQGVTNDGFLELSLSDGTTKTFVSAEHIHDIRPVRQ